MRALAALALALALGLAGVALAAGELALEGDFVQGGLVFGQAEPGAQITLEGRRLRVSDRGRFIFGFGRDAAPNAVLEVRSPDGRIETRHLVVDQHEEDREDERGTQRGTGHGFAAG